MLISILTASKSKNDQVNLVDQRINEFSVWPIRIHIENYVPFLLTVQFLALF